MTTSAHPEKRAASPLEELVEGVLSPDPAGAGSRAVLAHDVSGLRAVILGGGTGMSTVVGGNSAMPDWPAAPFVGLKEHFPHLDVVVCTTDDGGSTGRLLQELPMIGIGDLRKSCLSLVSGSELEKTHGLSGDEALKYIALIQRIFNHRFHVHETDESVLVNPLLAVPVEQRGICPDRVADALRALGTYLSSQGEGPTIQPTGHSLGNLLLTAAVFRAAGGRVDRCPTLEEIRTGLDEVARLVGSPSGRLHAVTSTPGQLVFAYSNGVEVYGQRKAAVVRRGLPVEHVEVEFVDRPEVSGALCDAISNADLIIYAPGSVYSSMIPLLQVEPIAQAIRGNGKALKILGANFWVQEGETDISPRNDGRGFLVSELIEAYDRNVPGGAEGLFEVVLCANLEHVPGNVLRNYALEGKRPIHLDRSHVEAMGLSTVEATVFSRERLRASSVIHHDARNFALAVKALCYARGRPEISGRPHLPVLEVRALRADAPDAEWRRPGTRHKRTPVLCHYLADIRRILRGKTFDPESLRDVMVELAWENRDIQPAHLACFSSVRVVSPEEWGRSTDWDNVLGYYDPGDRSLKVHASLVSKPARLREDLLIALGESLLGRYIAQRRWIETDEACAAGSRCYEIRLAADEERDCLPAYSQLCTFLRLARMVPDATDPKVFRITINDDEGFLPPGLLFGLLYAWYLNNAYGGAMDYEMSLLRWPPQSLMPQHAKEQARKRALVGFFRREIFGHRRN